MTRADKITFGIGACEGALLDTIVFSWLGYGWAQTITHVIGWIVAGLFGALALGGAVGQLARFTAKVTRRLRHRNGEAR